MPKTTKPALDDLEAEARAGQTDVDEQLPAGTVTVDLAGQPLRVLPTQKWRSSSVRALRLGDFESWAEKCLAGDDYEQVWVQVDPDLEQVDAFFTAWKIASGQDLGK